MLGVVPIEARCVGCDLRYAWFRLNSRCGGCDLRMVWSAPATRDPSLSSRSAQPGIAVDRFAREIVRILKTSQRARGS